jgi:hypothetical protein
MPDDEGPAAVSTTTSIWRGAQETSRYLAEHSPRVAPCRKKHWLT